MGESPLAAMGVVVQWSSAVLLLLLLFRLRRSGPPRSSSLWLAAWAAQAVASSGPLVHATGILIGDPGFGAGVDAWLDVFFLPGTLLFFALSGLGALGSVGRAVTPRSVASAVLTALGVGWGVAFIDSAALTSFTLVVFSLIYFFGFAVGVARLERRERPRRFPLLAAAMVLFGAVTLVYQAGPRFGSLLWPLDDFVAMVGWSAGYSTALVSAVLGGALITLVVDDAIRGTVARHAEPARADDKPEIATSAEIEEPIEARVVASVEIAAVVEESVAVEPIDLPPVAPAMIDVRQTRPRTATLPRPPIDSNGQPAEVLVIDDAAAVRSTLARIFQRGGWSVRDASTGEEALAWLLDVPIDSAPAVVFCDVRMPGMGGREVHANLARERPELASRMIFVTDDVSRDSIGVLPPGTSCPVVEKPFTVSEIASAVEQVLAPATN